MTTSSKTKTTIPGLTPLSIKNTRKGSKKARVGPDIQATLRKFKSLHEADLKHKQTIAAEKKKVAERLVNYMIEHNFNELHEISSNFFVIKKERNNYTFTIDTQRLESELKFQKQLEIDTEQANNDPTPYASPLFRNQL